MTSILIVDDQPTARGLLAMVLHHTGYTVREATAGPEALALVRESPPDLIVADILMPGMDGYELVRALRREPAGADVRVVFCTATYGSDEVRRLAEACGVSHILVKPCEPEEIVRIVADALAAVHEIPPPLPPEEFHREHLGLLNAKLVEKIAELEESKRQAAESLTLLETLQSAAPVGIGFLDREFRMVRLNDTLAAVNGLPAHEQIGRTAAETTPDLWPQLEPIYRRVIDTGQAVVNHETSGRPPSAPDEIHTWLASYYPVGLSGEIIGIGMIVVDITERRQQENLRSVVMDNMAEGLLVTDAEGRLTFMNAAASRMLGWSGEALRGQSVHAAIHYQRPDGSAFPEHQSEILRVSTGMESISVANDAFTCEDGTILPVAYSAAPLDGQADVHGTVVVFRDTTEEQAERTRVQRELDSLTWVGRTRDALDEGRLVLYSQPIVSLNGAAPSEELLLRMVGRAGEVIPPLSFLPAAEKFGLIVDIDRWVVGQAIELAAEGRRVEVNLSAESIADVEMLSLISQRLRETGAEPGDLVFEITETALMRDIGAGQTFAEGLVALGCHVALDDFGTGFGSFTYLKSLPVKFLKIDIEFVRDLGSNPANQHLVKAIVSLAEGFGQQTIAEGVEDEETLVLLGEYGVDYVQGFHLGRPAPIARSAAAV